ncbi:MAG: 4Fe-4S binding protein, partial [Spirochaetales bacterium]|nr:4Fe-4S binding protein [Candidatus Physcosoma equi]
IAAGKKAAETLHRFVQGGHMTIGLNKWEFNTLDKDNLKIENYDSGKRNVEGFNKNVGPFECAHVTFTEEQVKKETARCLGCGATIVDPNKCLGCGVCTTKCMFGAITLHRDHPECSEMVIAEDKFKKIIPYELKRIGRIAVHYKPQAQKDYEKKLAEFQASQPKKD